MNREEFFLLIPAIIYGVALVDLLKVYKGKYNYWELTVWGTIMMLYIIIVWLELFAKLEMVTTNKWFYLISIFKAILVAQIAATITPEEKDIDHKKYFLSVRKQVFGLIGTLTLINLLLQEFFYNDERPILIRALIILLMFSNVIFNSVWLRVVTSVVIMGILIQIFVNL